jgi:hypothetical protein
MRLRRALLATVVSLAALVAVPVAAAPAALACEFPTWQYTFNGVSGTWRSEPGGAAQGIWYGGDLFNSGMGSNTGPWLEGNVYTSGGAFKGHGWVLRDYLSYLRNWC